MDSFSKIFGDRTAPYYIWAPRWVESSAGIRALHYLCHSINSNGGQAYLVMTEPRHLGEPRIASHLFTPELTQDVVDAHYLGGQAPIGVFSETVIGNPLGTPVVVRLLMNYSGVLGGPESFDTDEKIYAFSKKIADDYEAKGNVRPEVLFIPPVDPREFQFNLDKKPYQVVYAGKYRHFIGAPPKVGDLPTVEIFRDGPKRQPRDLVKRIISEASVVYSFENSSIVTESILSGTPAGFIESPFLGDVIAEAELGWDGSFVGTDARDIERARLSVRAGADAYIKMASSFAKNLIEFQAKTHLLSTTAAYENKVVLPQVHGIVTRSRVAIAFEILRRYGFLVLVKEMWKFIKSRLKRG
jgi:hypothetical protein